jgi:hypothetical protein
MTEAAARALAEIAPLMRGLVASSEAKPYYEVLSDALVWRDELPESRVLSTIKNWQVLRLVLHVRTKLIRGEPIERYEKDLWDEARILFPEWPGFAPWRSSPDLRGLLVELSADSRRELEEFERELEAMNDGTLKLNTEYPPPDEEADIKKMAALVQALHHPQKDGRVLRAQHAKDTGCVKAQLVVEPNLADEYRHGVFAEPRTFEVIIRFSNASEWVESDSKGTPRGMAIKLLGVHGERPFEGDGEQSQDFLLVDSPAFIFRAVKDYTVLFALRRRFKSDPLALAFYFLSGYFKQTINVVKATKNVIQDSLIRQYWSMSPFRLGKKRTVKWTAKPRTPPLAANPPTSPDNFLFETLAAHLKDAEASFDFMVQIQFDPVLTPIEDATIEWKESDAPFHKVATIRIPAQDLLGSDEMKAFRASCENLSFTPWHTLEDHRPMGGLNRLRRFAYEVSVERRRRSLS